MTVCYSTKKQVNAMKKFQIPLLQYDLDSLQPVISKQTLELHFGVHTKNYIDNLNTILTKENYGDLNISDIICNSEGPLFNNAAQAWNHIFYFNSFAPAGCRVPVGRIGSAINKQYGDFESFKRQFVEKGIGIFGSGWIWLARDFEGKLHIVPKQNAGNPMTDGLTPLLTFDVWEHAYYLDYKNRRAEYLNALWNILDWNVIEERF